MPGVHPARVSAPLLLLRSEAKATLLASGFATWNRRGNRTPIERTEAQVSSVMPLAPCIGSIDARP